MGTNEKKLRFLFSFFTVAEASEYEIFKLYMCKVVGEKINPKYQNVLEIFKSKNIAIDNYFCQINIFESRKIQFLRKFPFL